MTRTSRHHCYYKKFSVSNGLVAHCGTVETEKFVTAKQGKQTHHRGEKAKAAHVIEQRLHATDAQSSWEQAIIVRHVVPAN